MSPESFQERPDQNNADADAQKLEQAGLVQKDGVWKKELRLGAGFNGTEITNVEFRKNGSAWQWRNNSEPVGKWLDGERFPTAGVDADVKANREKMNKLADDLGVKTGEKEHDQRLQDVTDDFLNKERIAAGSAITPDVEYHVSWVEDSLGYLPFLEHLLEEMEDKDEWTGDSADEAAKERHLLQSTAQAIRRNMKGLSDALNAAPVKSGKAYEHLRSVYLQRAKRYTELMACVNEDEENVELRDAPLAMMQAEEMLPHMGIEEAIDWVEQTLAAIDGNDWQSSGLKETYGKLINTCKAGLQKKLGEEKANIGNDPAKASVFCGHAMELAKLFTDRGSPIDSDLTDIDFAEAMAKDAMGFEELAMRYVEKTLSEKNPLKNYVAEKRGAVLSKFATLPPENRNEQIVNIEALLNGNPTDVAGISEQYALLRNIESQMNGQPAPDEKAIEGEINKEFLPFLESAYVKFETFLDGTIGGAANLGEINAAIGEPGLSPTQVEAWKLLADIQGYGYDVSDKTWSYVAMGAKIAAMIAAGIAVGIATGGLGIVAASLAGGAAMTGINAVINQQGFDNLEDAFKTYGKDFVVNTATMGAARYLAAGRTAFQLSRAGLLKEAGGLSKVFSIAGKAGGAKLLGSLDDASSLGIRMFGAAGEGLGDLAIGTALDTTIKGGEFMQNLQNNAMFFGLSFAEFGQQGIGGLWKKLRSAPNEQLHGLSQLVNKANLGRMNVHKLSGGIHVEDLLSSADPAALLKKNNVGDAELKQIFEELDGLKKTKAEFEEAFKKAAALPDVPDAVAPQSNEEKIEAIKKTIMDLPDTPDGLAKRVEAGAFVLGGKTADLTPAQSQAILDAHAVPMADGQKYSMAELKQKMQVLEAGGFTRDQADTLLRMGVCGHPPKNVSVSPAELLRGVDGLLSLGRKPEVALRRADGVIDRGYRVTGKNPNGTYVLEKDGGTFTVPGFNLRSPAEADAYSKAKIGEVKAETSGTPPGFKKLDDVTSSPIDTIDPKERVVIAFQNGKWGLFVRNGDYTYANRSGIRLNESLSLRPAPGSEIKQVLRDKRVIPYKAPDLKVGDRVYCPHFDGSGEAEVIVTKVKGNGKYDAQIENGSHRPCSIDTVDNLYVKIDKDGNWLIPDGSAAPTASRPNVVPPPPPVPKRAPNVPPPPPPLPGKPSSTMQKSADSTDRTSAAGANPSKAPELVRPILTPDLSKRIAKAADIAGDPGVKLGSEITQILANALQKSDIRVYIHDQLNPGRQTGVGYQTFGNERADLNAPRDASGSGSISDRDPRAISNPQSANKKLNALLQEVDFKKPDNSFNSAANRESIRLTAEGPPGKKSLVYMYRGINYKDSSSLGRPGTVMGVLVQFDAKDADAAFAALKKNPEQARAFFVAASAEVKRSDRIWQERRPNYEEANADRQLVFAKENGQNDMPEVSFMKPGANGWQEHAPSEKDQKLLKDIADILQQKKSRLSQPQGPAPRKPDAQKGFFRGLFG